MFEVKFNTEMHRWEVYSPSAVTRAGEKQPSFVAASYFDACAYVFRCGGMIG